jgi:Tfp pilus assembly protein PilN
MAKVNLLKAEMGGGPVSFVAKVSLGRVPKALLLLSAVCILCALLVSAHSFYLKSSFKNISSEYKEAEKLKKEIGLLHQQGEALQEDIALLRAFLKRDVIWSAKLEQLQRIIPEEVWLRNLSFEKKQGEDGVASLTLSGALVPSQNMNAIATLSDFINRLKENKEFSESFGKPTLSDVRSEPRENTEVMNFLIEMPLEKKGVDADG